MIWKAKDIWSMQSMTARTLRRCGGAGTCAALAISAVFLTATAAPDASEGHLQADAVVESNNTYASERGRDELAGKLARHEVQRSMSSIPGFEIVQVTTEIPPGVESGWHIHPGEEVGYIMAGSIEMMIEGRSTVVLRTGHGFLIPPRTPHNARDLGPETGHMLSTYIVEADQPLSTFVSQPQR
jgi:quercetin dioxygenase-like cupin family protein